MGVTSSQESAEESLQSNSDLLAGEDGSTQDSRGGLEFMQIIQSHSLFRRRQGPDLYDDGKTTNKNTNYKRKSEYNRFNKRYMDGQTPLTLAIRDVETNGPDVSNLHPALTHPDVSNLHPTVTHPDVSNLHPALTHPDVSNLHPTLTHHDVSNLHPALTHPDDPNLHPALTHPDVSNLHPALTHPDVDVNYPELQQTGLYSYGECPPLIVAIKSRKTGVVALLLGRGARVDATDFNKHSALYYAAEIGNLNIFHLLMDYKPILSAVPDVEDPLHAACRHGHIQIVRRLVEAGADVNPEKKSFVISPILLAAENKHEDICIYLLKNLPSGSNKLRESVFVRACWFGSTRVVQYLIQYRMNVNAVSDNNSPALVHAIRSGDLSRYERELKTAQGEKRIQLFSNLRTVLKESVEIISMLCDNGADLEVETGPDKVVPLELCLKKGNIPAAILLLKHGAKVDVQFDSVTETRLFHVDPKHLTILLQFLHNVPKSIYKPRTYPYSIRSLKDSCRHVIRSSVRGQFTSPTSILPTLWKLPFPTYLKEYLCYSEIDISEIVDNFQLSYFTELT